MCGLHYEREHGYFLNSMFIAYAAGFLVLIPSAILLALNSVSIALFSIVIIAETIVIWPLIFRYSRAAWLHIDQVLDPRTPPDPETLHSTAHGNADATKNPPFQTLPE